MAEPTANLTQAEVERLRARMRIALSETVGDAAKRLAGTNGGNDRNGKKTIVRPTARERELMEFVLRTVAHGVRDEIARLEQRVHALEQKPPPLQYEGTWSETRAYNAGSFVTFQGGLWFCQDTNMGVRPGAGSSSWKLAVKRGRGDR
jgi:hypothetical protein